MSAPWSRPDSGWPLGAGAFLVSVLIASGVGVAAKILSPALTLDLISLWAGLVPAVIAALVVTFRKAWRRRFGALPFLLVLTWFALCSAAHFDGWPPLPSSAAELQGPDTVAGAVVLAADLAGALEVRASPRSHLYEVKFIRQGGEVGVPEAEETTLGDQISVELIEMRESPWLRYAGWNLLLSADPNWELHFRGETIEIDLTGLQVISISVEGEGEIVLGDAVPGSQVEIRGGEFEVSVPGSAPVTVNGAAAVPDDWDLVEGGFQAPEQGPGWLIVVADGATVRIVEP